MESVFESSAKAKSVQKMATTAQKAMYLMSFIDISFSKRTRASTFVSGLHLIRARTENLTLPKSTSLIAFPKVEMIKIPASFRDGACKSSSKTGRDVPERLQSNTINIMKLIVDLSIGREQ
jgi:uncharacterized membrane protein